jgi:ABC-type dipeptide/oligopeptide/nickel transport system permease component
VIQAVFHGRFILPWITLALSTAAFYSRMVRGNLMETMGEDYIRTARAKGLSERTVIYEHGLRGALTPVVTMFGPDVAFLLGGAVVTETVFQLQGLGLYAITALTVNDFPPGDGGDRPRGPVHPRRESDRRRRLRDARPSGQVRVRPVDS